jgi:putative transposase
MVQPESERLSVRRQCDLFRLSRSGYYYEPVPVSREDLTLMKRIDRLYTQSPFFGSRQLTSTLRNEGREVNRKRVQRLMRVMGLEAIVPGPHTSRPHPQHPVYPYLLRGVEVTRPDQVWCTDITYIQLSHGFAYLVAVMDWWSRAVLSWRLSNSLSEDFCLEALDEALRHHGPPGIFNTDQGSQFTADRWIARLKAKSIRISMDGKGRCLDNVFVERLWRSLKYEEVYLKDHEDVVAARSGIGRWFRFYNFERPHQAHRGTPPMQMYRSQLGRLAA